MARKPKKVSPAASAPAPAATATVGEASPSTVASLPDNELERYAHARAVMRKSRDVALAYGCGLLGGFVSGQKSANLLLKIDNKADVVKARIKALGGAPDAIYGGL